MACYSIGWLRSGSAEETISIVTSDMLSYTVVEEEWRDGIGVAGVLRERCGCV